MNVEKLTIAHRPKMKALIEAVHADQGLLAQFYWPEDYFIPEMMTAESLGVFSGEELAGIVLYRDLGAAWEITLVASHPKFRRQGYMERLFADLISTKGQGRELWLEVHEENVPAHKFYEKVGFAETTRRPRYYNDGATAILYTYR